MGLTICPVNIPKSGKKLKTIGDVTFFFRKLKQLTYVYEQKSGIQVMVFATERGEEFGEHYIAHRLDEVKEFLYGKE